MDPRLDQFSAAHHALTEALKDSPRAQLEFLAAVDALYAAMDEANEILEDAQILEAQMLLRHAESVLTRYFGM